MRQPASPLELTTAFVYPFSFRWEEPTWRRFELSQRLIDVAIRAGGDKLAFYGPSEFRVVKAIDDGHWAASNAQQVLLAHGSRPEQGVIIRPWAEYRKTAAVQEAYDKKGKSTGMAANEETQYLGHLEVVHPSTGQVLVEVSGEVKVDPMKLDPTAEDEYDARRQLTALMAQLMREAVESLAPFCSKRSAGPDWGLTLALTPNATLRYHEGDEPAVELDLMKMEPIQAELFVQARAKFLAPFLSDAEVPTVVKLPSGLYVAAAPAGAKVSAGDLLLAVDGEPALPQALARRRFTGVPAQVKVRRASGEETEVVLP